MSWSVVGLPWALCVLLCTGALGAQAQQAPDAGAASEPSKPDAGDGTGDGTGTGNGDDAVGAEVDAEAEADDAALVASRAMLAQRRHDELQTALQRVDREREDSSLLLPWFLVGAGAVMSVVGIAIGASDALCDRSCTAPFWPTWLVVVGATAGTAGGLWLALELHDLSELRRRHDTLERELQYLKWSDDGPAAASTGAAPHAMFTLRRAF